MTVRLTGRHASLTLCLALAACGGGDGGGAAPSASISGVAAVGAPIVGGTVNATCGGGVTRTATTSTAGTYSLSVPRAALPCAMRVSGGNRGLGLEMALDQPINGRAERLLLVRAYRHVSKKGLSGDFAHRSVHTYPNKEPSIWKCTVSQGPYTAT